MSETETQEEYNELHYSIIDSLRQHDCLITDVGLYADDKKTFSAMLHLSDMVTTFHKDLTAWKKANSFHLGAADTVVRNNIISQLDKLIKDSW